MDGFDDRAFIEAYKRLATGTPQPGDREIVQSVRDIEAARGGDTAALDAVLGTDWGAQASALTPSTAPSVADQVAASMAAGQSMGMGTPASDPAVVWAQQQQQPGYTPPLTESTSSPLDALGALAAGAGTTIDSMPDPAGAILPNIPGLSATGKAILSGQEIPATVPPTTGPGDDLAAEATTGPSGVRVSPDTGMITPPQDFFGGAREAALGTDVPTPTANPLPDQGGTNDRKRARGRDRGQETDWTVEADAMAADPTSAFAGVSPEFLESVAANPDVAAQILAESRGGGAATTAAMTPQVSGALALSRLGLLGKGGDLNFAPSTPGQQLETAEDWLAQAAGPGQAINPASVYQRALRRARRTDPMEMDTGEGGEAGSIENQIAVTHGALSAALGGSGTTREAQEGISNRLDRAARAYMVGVATGDSEISGMSYPEYLRKIAKAQRWLGR